MKCRICGKEVILVPSAKERAKSDRGGHSAAYYTRLFPEHTECALKERDGDSVELMRRINAKGGQS